MKTFTVCLILCEIAMVAPLEVDVVLELGCHGSIGN